MPPGRFAITSLVVPIGWILGCALAAGAHSADESLAAGVGRADATHEADAPPEADGRPFALVELFTSEGCSSCPPADVLLAGLADSARDGRRVFPMSFHVDYWNSLGWKDPWSSAAWSDRQRWYASAMQTSRVYTPQMLVNGSAAFVGSDRSRSQNEIDRALTHPARAALSLTVLGHDAQGLHVRYRVASGSGAFDSDLELHFAITERGLESTVTRGENAGRKLRHEYVVRSLETRALATGLEGEIVLAWPEKLDASHAGLVAWIQGQNTGEVWGAAGELSLPPAGDPPRP